MPNPEISQKAAAIHQYLKYSAFEGGPVDFTQTTLDVLTSIGKTSSFFVLELFARFGIKSNKSLYSDLDSMIAKKCTIEDLEKHLIATTY